MKFEFAPLHSLGFGFTQDPFDLTRLPFQIADGLSIEDVRPRLPQDAFELWRNMLGESRSEMLGRVRYAIIHRFDPATDADGTGLKMCCSFSGCQRRYFKKHNDRLVWVNE